MTDVQQLQKTASNIEGPYWTPGSPPRVSLIEPGVRGQRLVVAGSVCDSAGKPITGAWVDFWQADGEGVYDNEGFRLRGHQLTDSSGRFRLETVVPGEYVDEFNTDGVVRRVHRTAHLHVKVKPPLRETLTTQLYFPGEPMNDSDRLFDASCLMEVRDGASSKEATFDFVI